MFEINLSLKKSFLSNFYKRQRKKLLIILVVSLKKNKITNCLIKKLKNYLKNLIIYFSILKSYKNEYSKNFFL